MRRRPILSSLAIVSLAFGAGCAGSPDIHGSGGAGGEGGRSSDATTGSHHPAGGGGQGGSGGAGGGANCGDGVCGADESCNTCSADCGACCAGGACCGNGTCDPGETCSTCPQDCKDDGGNACPRVGMFYLGWHQPAWNAVQQTKALGKPVLTVEDVIRSRVAIGAPPGPVYTFDQILNANGLAGVAGNFYYQATPKSGPYCIVHQRKSGDLNYDATHEGNYGSGAVPDCPGYEATLKRQAAELVSAGVDFIVTDQTNIADFSPFGDAIQLRPFEVVIEEWRALRKKGVKTPDVAGWQRMAQPGTMLPHVLAVYNAPENDRMMLRDSASGKKILFYPDVTDVDAGLVAMAAANGGKNDILPVPMWVNRQAQGSWSFFAQCQQGANLDDGACAQAPTTNSVVGSQLAVTPSYQLGYASLPFMAPGVFHGLTFRKQFETAFAVKPHWLFMSGYNEQIAQPQPNAPGVSMGLETDPTINGQAFVDTYGVEFSRDIEPSKEYGSLVYDLMASCLRVYRAGGTTCDKPDEACCKGGNFSDRYARFDGAGGPFVVYATALGPDPSRSALYQCRAGAADDFFSSDPTCEGTTVVAQVGFMSTVKGGETLRSLLRCFGTGGHAYSLVATCPAGKNPEAVLGYVR